MSTQKNYRRPRSNSNRGTGRDYRNERRPRRDYSTQRDGSTKPKEGGFVAFFKRLFGMNHKPEKAQELPSRPAREAMFVSEKKERISPDSRQRSKDKASERLQGMLDSPPEVEAPRLYVGNLAYETSESDLFDLFSQVGAVKNVEVIRDRQNSSKGFGFVEMESLDTAKAASAKYHRFEFMGRPLIVGGARPS